LLTTGFGFSKKDFQRHRFIDLFSRLPIQNLKPVLSLTEGSKIQNVI
jgi:hypothetical protein